MTSRGQGNGRIGAVPRDERTTRGNQARLVPERNIQGRLGSERRLERRRKEGGTAPGAKTYWGRNRKRKDGSGLDGKEGIGSMLLVWKKEHFQSECGEAQRIRILELEKELEELKGKGEQ